MLRLERQIKVYPCDGVAVYFEHSSIVNCVSALKFKAYMLHIAHWLSLVIK